MAYVIRRVLQGSFEISSVSRRANGGSMPLQYNIHVSKERAQVKATWDIRVDIADTELISNFTLKVGGTALNTECSGGNKACKGADFTTLTDPNSDCPVTFVITTNKPDEADGSDVLRGAKTFDDVNFDS
jgi:hypothetical protein